MKKNIFIILLFFSFYSIPISICGQSQIDSLKSIVESAQVPTDKLAAAIDLAHRLLSGGNSETKKYLEIAQGLLNKYPDSLSTARLEKIYANYYVYAGDYKTATELFLNSIQISEKIGNTELRNNALNGLAQLNIRTKNYGKGIAIFKKLLEYAQQKNDKNDIILYSLNLAMANGDAGNFDVSEKYIIDVYKSDPKNKFYKAVAANSLSFIYNNKKEYAEALKYGKEAAEFSKNIPDVAFKIESLTNYSNALKGIGKYIKAGRIMNDIVDLARKNNFVRKMNNAIGNLALNFEAMKNYKSAYKYYKQFSERRDSLLNESTTKQINELQIKYETAKKDNEIREKTSELERKNLILYLSVLGIILFVAISIVIFILYRKKNAAYKELVKKNLEIIKHEDKILDNKRNEIAQGKYTSSSLSDDKKENLNDRLIDAIREEKIFLNSNISLGKLAQKFDVNSKYLSQVIHEYYNSSFSDFINQLRIKEAAQLLSDKSYRHISMEGISEMVGFNTKSSFNTYFKKFIGVTPSFFASTSQTISEQNTN